MKTLLFALTLLFAQSVFAVAYQPATPVQHNAVAPAAISVTTASVQAFASNGLRTALECTNTGASTVFLGYGTNAAIVNGGTAITAGSTWWMDDYLFTVQSINVISVASGSLACQEFQ